MRVFREKRHHFRQIVMQIFIGQYVYTNHNNSTNISNRFFIIMNNFHLWVT